MLGTIRKFSSSITAKIFLFVVAIPFIFWGMGPLFKGGNINTIVKIGNAKIPSQEFVYYLQNYMSTNETSDTNLIEKLLPNFIGEKLIEQEIKNFDIKLSNDSLSKIIKNQKAFKKENIFSRTEYEKFLVKNSLNVIAFEANLLNQEKKKQLFDFIGGGIIPSNFLINTAFDKINQKRNIEIINLNDVFMKKFNFSENQIESYFNKNKDKFKEIFKTVNFTKLNPIDLTEGKEFNDLYFKKIDEIDDLIVGGRNLDFILQKFNLKPPNSYTFNKLGNNKDLKKINNLPDIIINNAFNIAETEPTVLIELKDEYFIIELTKTETVQNEFSNDSVKKEILSNLENQTKRKLIAELIGKINKNSFKKTDFEKLSKDESVDIKKVKLRSRNDDKVLKKELINQIYTFAEKKIIVVADISLSESFLVYIDEIENAYIIDKNSKDYKKYSNLAKVKISNELYNTYDTYLKQKYKISINYKALDNIKNYFK